MTELTPEHFFDTIKNGHYKNKEEAVQLIRQYSRAQSEQLRNMNIEDHFKDLDPQVINEVKSKKLPGNY